MKKIELKVCFVGLWICKHQSYAWGLHFKTKKISFINKDKLVYKTYYAREDNNEKNSYCTGSIY